MKKVSRWGPSVNLRMLAYAAVALLLVALGAHAATAMRRPFGPSHDGVNAAVWGWGSRGLRGDGIAWSRMATRHRGPDGISTYANHPPLIAVEAAAAEEVFGEHPWSTRLPAILATAVALVGMVVLLRTLGIGLCAAVAGVVLAFGVPIVGVYGAMLDTPIVGLAPAVILLVLDARARRGLRSPPVAIAVAAAICVLSSWQGVILAGILAVAASWRIVRKRALSQDWALVVGAVVALVLLAGWLWWAFGSWGPLTHQFTTRSGLGTRRRTLGDVLHALGNDARQLLPVWVAALAIPGLVVALHDRRTRWATAVTLATVAGWVFGFRDGAVVHDYWPYWVVLPLAVGLGTGMDVLVSRIAQPTRRVTAQVSMTVAAVALACVGLTASTVAGTAIVQGAVAARTLLAAQVPSTQSTLWFAGPQYETLDWATYDTRRKSVAVPDADAIRSLGEDRPKDLVFVVIAAYHAGRPCSSALRRDQLFAVLPAADLAGALDGNLVRPC